MPDGFHAARARAIGAGQLLNAYLELTYACNWRCRFCYNPRHFDLEGLSVAEWTAVLDDLRALGTMNLTLTGGEPLAYHGFLDIVRAARERHFTVRVFTNGSLVDAKVARELAALFVLGVEMSLHGATAAVHDHATQRPGSYAALMVAVHLLREAGVDVVLKSPITSMNEHQIDAMIDLATESGIPLRIDGTIMPRDDGDPTPLQWAPSEKGLRRVAEIGVSTGTNNPVNRAAGAANCGIGSISITIDPEGNVYPCPQWRTSAYGNVRQTRLADMWSSSPLRSELRALAVGANDMLLEIGDEAIHAQFCPALAQKLTGSPLTPDSQFLARARLTARVREEQPKDRR